MWGATLGAAEVLSELRSEVGIEILPFGGFVYGTEGGKLESSSLGESQGSEIEIAIVSSDFSVGGNNDGEFEGA